MKIKSEQLTDDKVKMFIECETGETEAIATAIKALMSDGHYEVSAETKEFDDEFKITKIIIVKKE